MLTLQLEPCGKPNYTVKSTEKASHRVDAVDCWLH